MELNEKQRNAIKAINALRKIELLEFKDIKKLRSKPIVWVNPFLAKRELFNIEEHLMKDLLWGDSSDFKNFCRMKVSNFEEIFALVESSIKRTDTRMRYAISARVRLAITLRFLASGDSYRSLEFLSRVSRKTMSKFIPEVLSAICDALQPKYLTMPTSKSEWAHVAEEFNAMWQFPHTLGAMDGKHIKITAPQHSGSDFFNYKGFFSIVLFAVVNAHSKFIFIDVGANGRASDNVIFKSSYLYDAMQSGKLNVPDIEELPGQHTKLPYFFIGDDIFGLDKHVMKAYNRHLATTPQKAAFSYRLRARMTVEMAFGRLANRFRVFHRPLEVGLDTADLIIKTCCTLHNFLSKDFGSAPPPADDDELILQLPDTMTSINEQEHPNRYKFACRVRDDVSKYLITDGNVCYQWPKINAICN